MTHIQSHMMAIIPNSALIPELVLFMHYVMCILQILPRGYPSLDMGIVLHITEKLSSGLTHLCPWLLQGSALVVDKG
jgi:hypothetical protein